MCKKCIQKCFGKLKLLYLSDSLLVFRNSSDRSSILLYAKFRRPSAKDHLSLSRIGALKRSELNVEGGGFKTRTQG